jgi:outer membrane receptor protein involved in Fe transport
MKQTGRRVFRNLLGLGCSLTVLAGPAFGQTAAGGEGTDDAAPEITVTGSRIPRLDIEGPAPITVVDSNTIRANGYASVPDILRALTQNGGETQSQQSFSGASFTPGAQQVDLRGLGPITRWCWSTAAASPTFRCHSRAAATSPTFPTSRSA